MSFSPKELEKLGEDASERPRWRSLGCSKLLEWKSRVVGNSLARVSSKHKHIHTCMHLGQNKRRKEEGEEREKEVGLTRSGKRRRRRWWCMVAGGVARVG